MNIYWLSSSSNSLPSWVWIVAVIAFFTIFVILSIIVLSFAQVKNFFFHPFFFFSEHNKKKKITKDYVFGQITESVTYFSRKKMGCLIVFKKDTPITPLLQKKGFVLNADVSSILLKNIFAFKESQLHDGAVLIDTNLRISAAAAILPLPKSRRFSRTYGTRHNAAKEITSRSDAFALVVSETGKISFFHKKKQIVIDSPAKITAYLRKNCK